MKPPGFWQLQYFEMVIVVLNCSALIASQLLRPRFSPNTNVGMARLSPLQDGHISADATVTRLSPPLTNHTLAWRHA